MLTYLPPTKGLFDDMKRKNNGSNMSFLTWVYLKKTIAESKQLHPNPTYHDNKQKDIFKKFERRFHLIKGLSVKQVGFIK